MVRGLDLFKKHFSAYTDKYVLIGGVACSIEMEEAGLEFRATVDLDIVLNVEVLDNEFVAAFWKFVRGGGYEIQVGKVKRQFYRFMNPKQGDYPKQLELLSRQPDALSLPADARYTPIPTDVGLSSLSAILLEEDYYDFIMDGTVVVDGLPMVRADRLIPLKMLAWMNLRKQRQAGDSVGRNKVNKHRSDVIKLYQLMSKKNIVLPDRIISDMRIGMDLLLNDDSINLKDLGLGGVTIQTVVNVLKTSYGLE